MYAIIKTGGKQYRVQHGETLLIERLSEPEGATVDLLPLLIVDGDQMKDGDALQSVTVQATIVAHERGPKLRIVKFKPKRGYKNRTGHRQNLTRIEITSLDSSSEDRSTPAATPTEVSSGS
jgi:large subunit ribosomal protein L21